MFHARVVEWRDAERKSSDPEPVGSYDNGLYNTIGSRELAWRPGSGEHSDQFKIHETIIKKHLHMHV